MNIRVDVDSPASSFIRLHASDAFLLPKRQRGRRRSDDGCRCLLLRNSNVVDGVDVVVEMLERHPKASRDGEAQQGRLQR